MNKPKLDVLVVDDDPINLSMIVDAAKELGLRCAVATNGLDALACLEQVSVKCVVTDVDMPVMDGLTLIRMIRSRISETLPIISVSANESAQLQVDLIESGANMFLSKPCNLETLYRGMSEQVASAI